MILIDFDNTVVDTSLRLKKYLNSKGYKFYPENIKTYDYQGHIGVARSRVYNCFMQPSFYAGDWEYFNGAIEGINLLCNVDNAKIWTAVADNLGVIENRQKQLNNLKQHCNKLDEPDVAVGKPKEYLEDCDAVFDDCLDNLQLFVDNGSSARLYLINQPYNKPENNKGYSYDKFIRVDNLLEGAKDYISYTGR